MIPHHRNGAAEGRSFVRNREQWLTDVAVLLRPWFRARGYEIPLRVRLGVGALASNHRTLGVCHCAGDRDGYQHITISPYIDDPVLVAAVLAHELIHAILPPDEGHGRRFAEAARAIGFQGRVTNVEPGPDFQAHLKELTRQVGAYPHKALVSEPLPGRRLAAARRRGEDLADLQGEAGSLAAGQLDAGGVGQVA